ncbi:MAG TPA: hypothetical protein VHD90_21015 [Phototrophicaceae bacterium]|nr:hypothetical protein [Phototrophicaceae bacterium]
MGFFLQIQADHGSEMLRNVHPEGKASGGNALLGFLVGLQNYCTWEQEQAKEYPELVPAIAWFQQLEADAAEDLCDVCGALLDCMWGDGGDPTEYHDDEYAFYSKRYSGAPALTEEQFKRIVWDAPQHWEPIEEVMKGVRLLLGLLQDPACEPLAGVYHPEDTIPDFEALYANLELLAKRGNELVRLNFI